MNHEKISDRQPLSRIKIVDATSVLTGPYCTMLLGDMGAEVIKIEPIEGDMIRNGPPFIKGESAYFLYTNRNKKGITLNLKTNEGRDILLELIKNIVESEIKYPVEASTQTLQEIRTTFIPITKNEIY